jgi:DNA-binding CsgD family transcriptional regulator
MQRGVCSVRKHNRCMRDPLSSYDTTALLRELTRRLEHYWSEDPSRREASFAVGRWRVSARRHDVRALPRLSPRERQIAAMVASGDTNKAVAHHLGISAWTVAAHLRRIFEKLDVHTRAAMVARIHDHARDVSTWPLTDATAPASRGRALPVEMPRERPLSELTPR